MFLPFALSVHIIAIIISSFTMHYYHLVKNTEQNKSPNDETKNNQIAGLTFAIVLFFMAVIGIIIIFMSDDYDFDTPPVSCTIGYIGSELVLIIINYILTFIIVYHEDYGLLNNHELSDYAKEQVVATMAVSYVFLCYLIIIGGFAVVDALTN